MNPFTKAYQGMQNIFNSKSFMGTVRRNPQRDTESYSTMMKNRIARRRAANKVARQMRKKQISKRSPGRNKRLI